MKTIKLKKMDIDRILRGLSLLELEGNIKKKDYKRLYKRLFPLLDNDVLKMEKGV